MENIRPRLGLILVPPELQRPPRKLLARQRVKLERRTETRPNLIKVLYLQYPITRPVQLQHLGRRFEQLRARDPDFLAHDTREVREVVSPVVASRGSGELGGLVSGDKAAIAEGGGLEEGVSGLEGE